MSQYDSIFRSNYETHVPDPIGRFLTFDKVYDKQIRPRLMSKQLRKNWKIDISLSASVLARKIVLCNSRLRDVKKEKRNRAIVKVSP